MWNFRELTLAGKIQSFKSLALLKAVYVCTIISPSRQFLDQLGLMKRNFIWAGKLAKIKNSTLIGSYAEGGYKNVDINCSILQARLQCFVKISNPLDIALSVFLVFRNITRN